MTAGELRAIVNQLIEVGDVEPFEDVVTDAGLSIRGVRGHEGALVLELGAP